MRRKNSQTLTVKWKSEEGGAGKQLKIMLFNPAGKGAFHEYLHDYYENYRVLVYVVFLVLSCHDGRHGMPDRAANPDITLTFYVFGSYSNSVIKC